ncbi:MAG: SEC-C metal-binding domain-containing protein [Coriobacteriales bacterium]|nr:SEC-C metal-binding domain-containing protein [Coriobacteriales bacterium]
MSDEELVSVLEKSGMPVTHELLEELSRACYDCAAMEDLLIERFGLQLNDDEDDWCYCALIALAERWLPDWVSSDALDTHIQAGFDLIEQYPEDTTFAMDEWSLAWDLVPQLARAWRCLSTVTFDERFGGLSLLEDWLPEYENELLNLGRRNSFYEKEYLKFLHELDRTFPGYLRMSLGMWFDASGKLRYDGDEGEYEDDEYEEYVEDDEIDFPSELEKVQLEMGRPVFDLKNPYSVLKVGRNDPCPCGSGKKYKKCHGRPGA